ncbi:creatininase family protein [Tautonia rosea]|uniref:creatininase family protein n=1 Tax=Tautonia rosea TaxID=2728037 RepID=UPI0019CF6D8A|nr:creatininase family protein [Tautonia rosea]
MSWPSVAELDRKTPVVLPIAALEQHGHHMPVFTDSMLLGEVLKRVKQTPIAQRVLFAPLQWLGNSHHHLDMPGTVSATPRLYLDLLRDLAENFLVHGFRKIAFLNGHGGNIVPSQQVIFELRQSHRNRDDLLLTSLTYWESCDPYGAIPGLSQRSMGHACEWETSMMLALHPEFVSPEFQEVPEVRFGEGASPASRGWTMRDRSHMGHIGHPAVASAEKGEELFRVFSEGVGHYLQRMIDGTGDTWNL